MARRDRYKIYTTEFDRVVGGYQLVMELLERRAKDALETFDTDKAERDILESMGSIRRQIGAFDSFAEHKDDIPQPKDTAVSVLIDMSGSTRGAGAIRSFALADAFMRHAFHSPATVEINAFTTSSWKGGPPREKWLRAGKPANPGRLNDLLLVEMKSFDQPVDPDTYANITALYFEPLLRENIDGESVQWAAKRLKARPEANKILLVASDDAPVDDSTLSANGGDYLRAHLDDVCKGINSAGAIKLVHLFTREDKAKELPAGGSLNRYPRHVVSDFEDAKPGLAAEMRRVIESVYDAAAQEIAPGEVLIRHTSGQAEVLPRP